MCVRTVAWLVVQTVRSERGPVTGECVVCEGEILMVCGALDLLVLCEFLMVCFATGVRMGMMSRSYRKRRHARTAFD